MFLAALQIAGPLIAVLFLTDVAFGLLNRVAPALNAFSLGFPAKIMLTLTLAGTAIAVLPRALDGLIDDGRRRGRGAGVDRGVRRERREDRKAHTAEAEEGPQEGPDRPHARTSAPGSGCWRRASCCPWTMEMATEQARGLLDAGARR